MKKMLLAFMSMMIALSTLLHAEVPTQESVTKLYVATFNRAPDAAGLDYWVNDSGLQLEQISQSFFDQPETQELYPPETSGHDFVLSVYDNLFNREPDPEGLAYWEEELESGRIPKSMFILAVINGAQDTEEYGNDATILENKTIVGLAYADAGLDDVELAKEIMSGITDDYATVTAALETLLPYTAPIANAGPDQSAEIGQSITIVGTATDPDGTIVSYEWTKGTDVLATTGSFQYIPTDVGTDTLTLTVMDDDGRTASDSMNVMVSTEIWWNHLSVTKGSSSSVIINGYVRAGSWAEFNLINASESTTLKVIKIWGRDGFGTTFMSQELKVSLTLNQGIGYKVTLESDVYKPVILYTVKDTVTNVTKIFSDSW